jgi:hypothetical protein
MVFKFCVGVVSAGAEVGRDWVIYDVGGSRAVVSRSSTALCTRSVVDIIYYDTI